MVSNKPSPSQLRAARGLLNWSRADLAKKTGISEQTIHRFENGKAIPGEKTVLKLRKIIESNGIDFTDNDGVRRRPQGVEIFEGTDRFEEFHDFLYHHMLEQGGEVCLSVVDERLLAKYRRNPEIQRQRMRELVKTGYVTYRVLVTIGDFTGDYVEYKQQPSHAAAPTAFYAFGECLALISFPDKNPPHVVVVRSPPLTQSYRQFFRASWEKAQKFPDSILKKTLSHKTIQEKKT